MMQWLRLFFPLAMYADDPAAGGGSGNTGGGDWYASLPADLQGDPSISNFKGKSITDFAKGYKEVKSFAGSRKMADMDAPTDPEGRKAVLSKLGHVAPTKPDDYGLKYPDAYKGPKDDAILKSFLSGAHEAGLTKEQAQKLFDSSIREADGKYQKAAEAKASAAQRLETHFKKEWGDKYDENKTFAEKAWAAEFPDEKERKAFEELGFNLNPRIVAMFAKIGRMSQSGTMWTGTGNTGTGGDLASKRAELDKYQKENAQYLPGGPMAHQGLNETVQKIQQNWRAMLNQVADLEVAEEQKSA